MRAAGWMVALATAMTAFTLRAATVYWTIDGEAGDSFAAEYRQTLRSATVYWTIDGEAGDSFAEAYRQTLESADGKAENVVAWLYSLDASSGARIDYYESAVGVDGDGRMFCGESNPTVILADPSRVYGVQLGVLGDGGSATALFSSVQLTFERLVEMGAVQMSAVGVYDKPWNLSTAGWAVPEPNGALLVLVGTAILSLRRRCNA